MFLFFSLPYFTEEVWVFLQMGTVIVTEKLLYLFSIPVVVQEYFIAIPAGIFEVEESCSGVRYLANNLLLTFLFSFLCGFGLGQFT